MEVCITGPTKAIVTKITQEELIEVAKKLSYTNTSISFQLHKHRKNQWFKRKDPVAYEAKSEELNARLKNCLLKHDGTDWTITPGSIPHLDKFIDSVENRIVYPSLKPFPWHSPPEFNPYEYQTTSVDLLIKERHGNISLPTGCGKSFILLLLAQHMGLRTVVVTPSQSIFTELMEEFQARLGKHMVGGYGDGYKDFSKPVTIAIGKSLTMLKEGTAAYKFFAQKQVMLVDESHTFAAEQLNDVCHGVLADVPYRMFVSATQTRNDGTEKQLAAIIGKTVLSMDLKEAIRLGFLCPLNFSVLETFSPDTRVVADPTKCKRVHFLYNKNIANLTAKIANGAAQLKNQSTLILVEELEQIEMLVPLLKVPFAYVHSADKKKAKEFQLQAVNTQDQIAKFNKGEVKVLIGTKAISTGTNLYPTHNTVNWMGGSSEILTKQGAMGRSTRKLEISKFKQYHAPKPYTMIYDFRVKGVSTLDKHLVKRCAFYNEAGGELRYF